MRISTVMFYAQSSNTLLTQQGSLLEMAQKIATGKRVVRPSDDPQAAAQAVQVSQAQAANSQFTGTRVDARNALSREDSVLNSVGNVIIRGKTLVLEAANGTLSDADRASVASDLKGVFQTLVGLANSTDGVGRYMFGGYQNGAKPFVKDATSGNIDYVGGTQARQLRIGASRLMAVSDAGATVFMGDKGATGFMARADAGNSGSVTFKGPTVVDSSASDYGQAFQIRFSVDASGQAQYAIEDAAGNEVVAPQPYQSGQSIEHAGLSLTLSGTPQPGDAIDVDRARNMNTNLFKSFEKAIAALDSAVDNDAESAALKNTLSNVMSEFDHSLDNVLMVRASVGSRINELGVFDSVAGDRKINNARTKSDLVDLDYATAISKFNLRWVGLKAAQKSFMSMKDMQLFNML